MELFILKTALLNLSTAKQNCFSKGSYQYIIFKSSPSTLRYWLTYRSHNEYKILQGAISRTQIMGHVRWHQAPFRLHHNAILILLDLMLPGYFNCTLTQIITSWLIYCLLGQFSRGNAVARIATIKRFHRIFVCQHLVCILTLCVVFIPTKSCCRVKTQ